MEMTATKRIRIFPADRQQMEDIIASAEESELQKAYMEMLNGCLEHPKEWERKVLAKCGFKATGTIGVEGPRFIVYR